MSRIMIMVAAVGAASGVALGGSPNSDVVDFESGAEGWSQAGSFINNADGNPLPSYHVVFNNFGIDVSNTTNPAFLGDYGAKGPVTLSVDMKVNSISFFGQEVPREFIVELRDYDTAIGAAPWASVWASAGIFSASPDWVTLEFEILDPTATELPDGWMGQGAEDPNTFEPILPPGVTFADVLSGVDEIGFTTLVPGFFFGFSDHDVQFDNITIQPIPTPGAGVLALAAAPFVVRRRRA